MFISYSTLTSNQSMKEGTLHNNHYVVLYNMNKYFRVQRERLSSLYIANYAESIRIFCCLWKFYDSFF